MVFEPASISLSAGFIFHQTTPNPEHRRVVVPHRAQSCLTEGILRQQLNDFKTTLN